MTHGRRRHWAIALAVLVAIGAVLHARQATEPADRPVPELLGPPAKTDDAPPRTGDPSRATTPRAGPPYTIAAGA